MQKCRKDALIANDRLSLKTELYSNLFPKGGLPGESCITVSKLSKCTHPGKMGKDKENRLFNYSSTVNI